jgi:thioredoxin reductase (NADPH)
VSSHDNYHCTDTADGSQYSGCALLLATGSRYRRLGIPGEESYVGSGVHYCATCDGPFYRGKPVAVIGGGNSAAEESLFLVNYVERVTLLARGGELKGSQVIREKALNHPKIDVRFRREIMEFHGQKGKLAGVSVRNNQTGDTEEIPLAAVFVFIGQSPNTAFLNESGIRLDRAGYILTGHDLVHGQGRPAGYENREPSLLETSIPGIFAAGDARAGSTKQVASASGEGATAALLIRQYLKTT